MRRYDDPVDVRKGLVEGAEGPEQFLWRGRLWKVRAVVSHWVETGPWWQSAGVRAVLGSEEPALPERPTTRPESEGDLLVRPRPAGADLLAEREVWRVEAARGQAMAARSAQGLPAAEDPGFGVFDLVFDWAEGSWRLTRCVD